MSLLFTVLQEWAFVGSKEMCLTIYSFLFMSVACCLEGNYITNSLDDEMIHLNTNFRIMCNVHMDIVSKIAFNVCIND